MQGLETVVPVLVTASILLLAEPPQADCGNARWWRPDDSDPEIQRHLIASRLYGPECIDRDEPPPGCDALLALGERFLDYLLAQYEHARESKSRIHQAQSLGWLSEALRYGESTRSPTARRYVDDHRDAILQPPDDVNPDHWQQAVRSVLDSADLWE